MGDKESGTEGRKPLPVEILSTTHKDHKQSPLEDSSEEFVLKAVPCLRGEWASSAPMVDPTTWFCCLFPFQEALLAPWPHPSFQTMNTS